MEIQFNLDKADTNETKHGVSFLEAAHVFQDRYLLEYFDDLHSVGECRWKVMGVVDGILLVVVYTIREEVIRIISARKGTSHEKREYEKCRNRSSRTIQDDS